MTQTFDSLVLIKPDAIQHGLMAKLIQHFDHYGIPNLRTVWMDRALCRQHYREHVEKPFYKGLEDFMVSAPLVALYVVGPTDQIRHRAMQFRWQHEKLVANPANLVHASDSVSAAQFELRLWFDEPLRWNPFNGVAQMPDGHICMEMTNVERARRGLPVPWTPDLVDIEMEQNNGR